MLLSFRVKSGHSLSGVAVFRADTLLSSTLADMCTACTQVASALLQGTLEEDCAVLKSGSPGRGGHPGTAAAVEASLVYLRDRVRAPRDVSVLHVD